MKTTHPLNPAATLHFKALLLLRYLHQRNNLDNNGGLMVFADEAVCDRLETLASRLTCDPVPVRACYKRYEVETTPIWRFHTLDKVRKRSEFFYFKSHNYLGISGPASLEAVLALSKACMWVDAAVLDYLVSNEHSLVIDPTPTSYAKADFGMAFEVLERHLELANAGKLEPNFYPKRVLDFFNSLNFGQGSIYSPSEAINLMFKAEGIGRFAAAQLYDFLHIAQKKRWHKLNKNTRSYIQATYRC